MRKCYICKRAENFPAKVKSEQVEIRPYGPKGEDVCFQCAMSTPERQKQTEQSFLKQLDGCGDIPVIGLNVGPTTLDSVAPLLKGARPC